MAQRGERLSAQQRRRLSQLAIERHMRNLKLLEGEPSSKRCNKCGNTKPLTEFYKFKRKLASGIIASYPQSRCKKCDIVIRKRNWERQKANGVDVAALKRRYEANEDPERRRQRWRENQAILRRKAGRSVQPRVTQRPAEGAYLDIEPLALFLERELEIRTGPTISAASGIDERRLTSILRREYKTVSLRLVDSLLSGLGVPHELPILYPEEC